MSCAEIVTIFKVLRFFLALVLWCCACIYIMIWHTITNIQSVINARLSRQRFRPCYGKGQSPRRCQWYLPMYTYVSYKLLLSLRLLFWFLPINSQGNLTLNLHDLHVHMLVLGYWRIRLDELVLMSRPDPKQIEFDVHHRLESCTMFQHKKWRDHKVWSHYNADTSLSADFYDIGSGLLCKRCLFQALASTH